MLKHFTGTHDHRMDDKGRVSLPTEFRRVLDAVGSPGSLYVVPGLDDARGLAFLSTDGYSNLIERHNTAAYPSQSEQRRWELKIIGRAGQIQVDDAGRIVIAKPLRAQFGLEKEVRFVGVAARFELWRPDLRDAYEAEVQAEQPDAPFELDLRGLHS